MARSIRVDFPGAVHHIIAKGNNGRTIFLKDADNMRFLETLYELSQKYPFDIYAYCLMGNHFHLLIETKDEPLYLFMQRLLTNYVQWFNRKYNIKGHLLGDRYKGILVDKDNYFLTVLRYIHLNPVNANIVSKPEEYKWSSYNEYIGEKWIVNKEKVFEYFNSLDEFIEFSTTEIYYEPEIKKAKNILYYGNEEFINKILSISKMDERKEIRKGKITLDDINSFLKEKYGKGILETEKNRKDFVKNIAVLLMRDRLHFKWKEIGEILNMTPQGAKKIYDETGGKKENLEVFDNWYNSRFNE
uniref:Transposase n=1 Tax=candidate division WOR-3 bacterium TaxID=2052148 RepID=A0A7C4Y8Z0_UNCW3